VRRAGDRTSTNGRVSGPAAERGLSLGELQRARILAAMSTVVSRHGVERATVTQVIKLARVPRGAFYQHFTGRDDALRALVANAMQRSHTRVLEGSEQEIGWQRKMQSGLVALLTLYETEPDIGRLCLLHSHQPEPAMQRLRGAAVAQLTRAVAAGASRGRSGPGALSAECTVAGVLGVLEARLAERRNPRLSELAGELTSFIVLPYRGAAAARNERARGPVGVQRLEDGADEGGVQSVSVRMTYRTMRVLAAIGSRPGLSNVEVSEKAGIGDQGQISKLLKRLRAIGLVENTGGGQELGAANEWRLTNEGRELERSILDHHVPRGA
jgi:AcrR family transcriptional regulator